MNEITFDLKNKDRIKQIISEISSTKNINEIKSLVKGLQSLTKGYPCCKICGEPLSYQLMNFKIIGGNRLIILTPTCWEHEFDNDIYKLEKCYDCIKEHFKDDMPSMQRYLFMVRYRWAKWIYDIPEEVHKQIRSDKCGVTLENLIRKWGKEDGERRWKEYCDKQSLTNTFEYKQEKYGWTKEQFDEYNKSRAVTLENLIQRHGEVLGKEKWDHYVSEQQRTKSWDYMVEKFGEDKAKEINQSKSLCLDTFIRKYGKEIGKQKFEDYCSSNAKFYSYISQEFFNKLTNLLSNKNLTIYFATKNHEFCIDKNELYNKNIMLDFYISELKLCIEFDGDIWHANPAKYKAEDKPTPYHNFMAKEIWQHDKERQEFIESQGIKVVRIWESEYKSKDFDINKFITEKMGIELDDVN